MTGAPYVSDAVVELLAELGCRYVPVNPGSSFRGFHDSLVNYRPENGDGLEVILCPHEEMCVAFAHAYAKATGEVGWAAVHDLVGLMHASMGLYNAWCDNTQMVVLGGGGPDDPAERRPIDWSHSANVQSALVREYVKWDDDPLTPQATLDSVAQAWQIAGSTPRKPTYVTLDAATQEAASPEGLAVPSRTEFAQNPPFVANREDVRRAAELLWAARLPALVAGQVGIEPEATGVLVDILEVGGIAGREERNLVALPTRHESNLTGDADLLDDADVLLLADVHDANIAVNGGKGAKGGFRSGQRYDGTIVELSTASLGIRSWADVFNAPCPADVRLVGDAVPTLRLLLEELRAIEAAAPQAELEARDARRRSIAARHDDLVAAQRKEADRRWGETPVSVHRLVGELWEAVKGHEWLQVLRNTRSWPESIWEYTGARQFLGHSGGGGIGYGPGAMLGGGVAARDRGQLAVGIMGDGEFMYGPGFLWSAVHHEIPMVVVVNNNHSYWNDEEHQVKVAKMRSRPVENAHVGIRIHQPDVDFATMARSQGAWGAGPITDPDDLAPTFAEAVAHAAAGGVAVVDVHTNPR